MVPDATPPAAPQLHELEREIMEQLWSRDRATVREVHEALNARSATSRAYTTVMTVMGRLAAKGVVRRHREGRSDVYAPALTRDEWMRARAEVDVDGLIEDFGDVALAHFARHVERLDPERREALRKLVEGDA